MKDSLDFSLLHEAVKRMKAESIIPPSLERAELKNIDETLKGSLFELSLKDIQFTHGIPTLQGRQVLLYIKDHSYGDKIQSALIDGAKGNKFHVADCSTLKSMRVQRRYERYVLTNDFSGQFDIEGTAGGVYYSGKTNLRVCKNCLDCLNYKDFKLNKSQQTVSDFKVSEFFETYSSIFSYLPSGIADVSPVSYPDNWEKISANHKKLRKYVCEDCGVDMSNAKYLMHVHHINGNKGDTRGSNLKALCADCHKKQPAHSHMFVTYENSNIINQLRIKQCIIVINSWADVYKYSDTSLHGIIGMLKSKNATLPSVSATIEKTDITVDLAWKNRQTAVSRDVSFKAEARLFGWVIYDIQEAMEYINRNSSFW